MGRGRPQILVPQINFMPLQEAFRPFPTCAGGKTRLSEPQETAQLQGNPGGVRETCKWIPESHKWGKGQQMCRFSYSRKYMTYSQWQYHLRTPKRGQGSHTKHLSQYLGAASSSFISAKQGRVRWTIVSEVWERWGLRGARRSAGNFYKTPERYVCQDWWDKLRKK